MFLTTKKAAELTKSSRSGRYGQKQKSRRVVKLAAIGAIDFIIISLYQTGIIKKLPAYQFGFPDAPLSLTLYAGIMTLSFSKWKITRPLLYLMVMANALGGAQYLVDMTFKQKKICLYCLAGALLNFKIAHLLWPEVENYLNVSKASRSLNSIKV